MSPLLPLTLSHLIADFPLQTNRLYRLKNDSTIGILLHSGIHAAIAFLIMGMRWDLWYIWLFLLISHALTDWAKLNYRATKEWEGFLLDQITHMLILVLIALWQPGLTSPLPDWLIYTALAAALLPAVLMFLWIYAGDVLHDQTLSPGWAAWMRTNLLQTSRISGYPSMMLVLIGIILS